MGLINELIEKICMEHCKFPEQYEQKYSDEKEAEEMLEKEHCENCILNKL